MDDTLPTLSEALQALSGLGWVHWYIHRGQLEDYLPEALCFDEKGSPIYWTTRFPNDSIDPDIRVPLLQHGHKRFLYVETSAGLNMTRDLGHEDPREDIQKRLTTHPAWAYLGSGTYYREVSADTDPNLDSWNYAEQKPA